MAECGAASTLRIEAPAGVRCRPLAQVGARVAEHLLCFGALNRVLARVEAGDASRTWADRVLDDLQICCELAPEDLARIPHKGPVLLVANHPTGGVECLALLSALARVRPDFKLLANRLLAALPGVGWHCIFIEALDAHSERNVAPLRSALRHLRDGGLLAVFPAGSVSHFQLDRFSIADGPWLPAAARLACASKAVALPVHFSGTNSTLFHAMGLLHPRLRTLQLPKEFLNKRCFHQRMSVGRPVPPERLAAFASEEEATAYLRERVYALRHREDAASSARAHLTQPGGRDEASVEPIAPPVDPALLGAEVRALPADALLHAGQEYQVWVARAERIPAMLREIGRLREEAFRGAGEGSGKTLDLDRFDEQYEHLFVWHAAKQEVLGAYRIGRADELHAERGELGLYTSTLFRFRPELFRRLLPALELGRSFVRPGSQRSPALMLLWKGIGAYVVRHPRYKHLFGPVSISGAYRHFSRDAIVRYLIGNGFLCDWSKYVVPRLSFRSQRSFGGRDGSALGGLDDLSALISDVESDGKGLPVLLRQYLRLGGRVLGFNVDPEFSWVLDCLVLVDLTRTDPTILRRYMGSDGMESFLRSHAAHDFSQREKAETSTASPG